MVVGPTGTTTAVVAESRRAEGYDTNGSLTPGILVSYVDTSVSSGNGALKVLPINDSDISKSCVTLQPGGSLTFNGVTITLVSRDANGDLVRVLK